MVVLRYLVEEVLLLRSWGWHDQSDPHCQLGNGDYACVSARRTESGLPHWTVIDVRDRSLIVRRREGQP